MTYENTVSETMVLNLLASSYELEVIDENNVLPNINDFRNPDGRVNEKVLIDIWNYIDNNSNFPCYALKLGQHIDVTSKGLLNSFLCQCETIIEAFYMLMENLDWSNSSEKLIIEENGEFTDLYYERDASKCYPESANYKSMARLVAWVREMTIEKVDIISTTFTSPIPTYYNEFVNAFSNDVTFSSSKNRIRFLTNQINILLPSYNPYTKTVLKNILEKNRGMYNIKTTHNINKDDVVELIYRLLPDHKANIDHVSEKLSISRQTLYRYLKKENTSFKKLLNDARKEKSITLLKNDSLNMVKVSELLGYTEISSFYHAFKKWHGVNVSTYRKKLNHGGYL